MRVQEALSYHNFMSCSGTWPEVLAGASTFSQAKRVALTNDKLFTKSCAGPCWQNWNVD